MALKKSAEKSEKVDAYRHERDARSAKEKKVGKSLEKIDTTSSTFVETKELGKSVEKKRQNRFLKWVTGGALGLLGFSAGKEIFDKKSAEKISTTAADVLTDNEKLKKLNDSAENTQTQLKASKAELQKASNLFGIDLVGDLGQKKETYRQKEYKLKNLWGDTWKNTAYKDPEQTKRRSWLGRVFTFIPALFFEYQFFRKIKKLEADGTLAKLDKAEESAKELKKKGKKAAGKVGAAVSAQQKTVEQLRTNTALKKLRLKSTKNLVRDYKNTISEATNNLQYKKVSAEEYSKSIEKASTTLFEKVKKDGLQKEFLDLIKQKKVPGLEVVERVSGKMPKIPVGSIGIANTINIAILDAVREGKFSTFVKSATSSQTLAEAFIPGVGIYHSIGRARHSDDPFWLKALDVGLNTAGDTLMAIGIVGGAFSGGAATAAAYAAKGSMLAVARGWMTKQSLKYAAKKVAKTGKNAAKISLITSPITIMLATVAKKFDSKKVEESFAKNILSSEQQRSLELAAAA